MNVKQLKRFLSDLPDSMEVTVSDGKGWLYEIGDTYRTITEDSDKKEKSVVAIQPVVRLEEVEE